MQSYLWQNEVALSLGQDPWDSWLSGKLEPTSKYMQAGEKLVEWIGEENVEVTQWSWKVV